MHISIVIPTVVRDSLYPLVGDLLRQRIDCDYQVVLISQPAGRIDRDRIPLDDRIVIHEEPLGRGFGYYRAVGAERARGQILVWIDDDERPVNDEWLDCLTKPIRYGDEKVVTAGTHIPLGNGYIADSISWLGLPGGAYPGFRNMWKVDEQGYTDHLCSGNCAIDTTVLAQVGGFATYMMHGNEDTELSARLTSAGVRIYYEESATVLHEPRSNLSDFVAWHVARGAAHRAMLARGGAQSRVLVGARLASSALILKRSLRTRYFLGVLAAMSLQYLAQIGGYLGIVQPRAVHGRQPPEFKKI